VSRCRASYWFVAAIFVALCEKVHEGVRPR
jgi:hypothetical protein